MIFSLNIEKLRSHIAKFAIPILLLSIAGPFAVVNADKPVYNIEITSQTQTGATLDVTGTAEANPYVGQLEQHDVYVDWGDGTFSETSSVNFVDLNDDKTFTGDWSNSHTYTLSGTYSVSAMLYHGQPNGQESSADAITTISVEVVIPSQCNDGIDNDGDGAIDYGYDAGCDNLEDDDETDVVVGDDDDDDVVVGDDDDDDVVVGDDDDDDDVVVGDDDDDDDVVVGDDDDDDVVVGDDDDDDDVVVGDDDDDDDVVVGDDDDDDDVVVGDDDDDDVVVGDDDDDDDVVVGDDDDDDDVVVRRRRR